MRLSTDLRQKALFYEPSVSPDVSIHYDTGDKLAAMAGGRDDRRVAAAVGGGAAARTVRWPNLVHDAEHQNSTSS